MESTGRALSIILSNLWTNEFRKSADCVARHLRKITSLIDSLSEDELFLPQQRAWRPPKHNGLFGNGFTHSVVPFTSFRTQIGKACVLKSYPHFFKKA